MSCSLAACIWLLWQELSAVRIRVFSMSRRAVPVAGRSERHADAVAVWSRCQRCVAAVRGRRGRALGAGRWAPPLPQAPRSASFARACQPGRRVFSASGTAASSRMVVATLASALVAASRMPALHFFDGLEQILFELRQFLVNLRHRWLAPSASAG